MTGHSAYVPGFVPLLCVCPVGRDHGQLVVLDGRLWEVASP